LARLGWMLIRALKLILKWLQNYFKKKDSYLGPALENSSKERRGSRRSMQACLKALRDLTSAKFTETGWDTAFDAVSGRSDDASCKVEVDIPLCCWRSKLIVLSNVIYGYFAHVTYPIEFSSNTTQRNAHLLVRVAINELPKILFFLLFYLILKSV
jgi:hypothetical protein